MRGPCYQRTGFRSPLGNRRWRLVLIGLVAVTTCCVLALSYRGPRSVHPQPPSVNNSFGQFPAYTEAERALAKMLTGRDEDVDLGLANWLIVADIPQFADMTREAYFRTLDCMVEQVRQDMAKRREVAIYKGKNPNDPDVRCSIFCGSIVALGFDYAEEFRQHDLTPQQSLALHGDGDRIFFAGLLRTRRGTCVSMPLVYLVIGQSLGMPVHLVAIGKHYFVRWQEPGYRMNIEATIVDRVAVTPDDSVYLEDEGLTKEQLRGSEMRNLTRQEVLAQLFFVRSGFWVMGAEKSLSRSLVDLSRAYHLAPDGPAIQNARQGIFARYGVTPTDTLSTLQEKERRVMRQLFQEPQQRQAGIQPPPSPTHLPATPAGLTPQRLQQRPPATTPR